MVLTRRVGKKRSFWRGLTLTVLTLGVYGYYWMYKAHDEVFKQYELDREGRDEGVVWLVLGLVIPILLLVYWWKLAENVTYVRARMRLPARTTPLRFVGLHVAGMLTLFAGLLLGLALVTLGGVLAEPAVEGEDAASGVGVMIGFLLVYGVSAALALSLVVFAYYSMQRDINESWDWYDAHMRPATAGRPPGGPPPGATDPYGAFDPPV